MLLLDGHHHKPSVPAAVAAVTGNECQNMIRRQQRNARIIQGLCFGLPDKGQKGIIAYKIRCGGLPISVLHIENGEDFVSAGMIERIEVDGIVGCVECFVLVAKQRAEHHLIVAPDVMPIDGDVPARCLEIRFAERKQRTNVALFASERMVQVVVCIIRLHDGIIDRRIGNPQPSDEISVGSKTGGQIHAGLSLLWL